MRFHIFILLFFISLSLVAQEKFILTDIQIDGNKITKDATVLRELSFKKGDTLSLQELTNKIEESKRNIEKQWLFNFIDFKYDRKVVCLALSYF